MLLIGAGALLGLSVLDVVDVPLRSLAAQLLFTLGVSAILFYGGLSLSLTSANGGDDARAPRVPGVLLTALITGAVAALALGAALRAGPALRGGAGRPRIPRS